jgi:hypothetical protein
MACCGQSGADRFDAGEIEDRRAARAAAVGDRDRDPAPAPGPDDLGGVLWNERLAFYMRLHAFLVMLQAKNRTALGAGVQHVQPRGRSPRHRCRPARSSIRKGYLHRDGFPKGTATRRKPSPG